MIDRRAFVLGGASAFALAGCGGGDGDETFGEELGVPMVAQVGPSAAAGTVQFVVEPERHALWITGKDGVRIKAGGLGREPGRLNFPVDVATFGELAFVVDTGNHRVQAFDARGQFQGSFGEQLLLYPGGIEVRRSEILVSDSRNGRIVGFDARGAVTRVFGQGLLSAPRGLAFDGDDLLVADPGLRKVVRLAPDGRVSGEIGAGWVLPWSVAADGARIFVTDASDSAIAVVERRSGGQRRVAVKKPPKSVKSRRGALHLS